MPVEETPVEEPTGDEIDNTPTEEAPIEALESVESVEPVLEPVETVEPDPLPEPVIEEAIPTTSTADSGATEFTLSADTVTFFNESFGLIAVMFGLVVGLLIASFGKELFKNV